MKKIFLIITFSFLIGTLCAQMMRYPGILNWLDDEYYLKVETNEDSKSQIFKVNAKTGKSELFHDKTFRDEVTQNLPEGFKLSRYSASTEYYNENVIIKDNDLYYYSRLSKEFRRLTDNKSAENNPEFSPNKKHIAFTRNRDLYFLDVETAMEHRLTDDGSNLIYNGWSSWVYMEEIHGRSTNYKAYWWSPDSKKIAFLKFDDTHVPEFPLFRADGIHGELEITHYPKVGDPNPGVKLGIIDITTKETIWLDCNGEEDKYIAFPRWTNDSENLFYQVLNRDQNDLKIILANAKSGEKKQVYQEVQSTWVDFFEDNGDLFLLNDSKSFIVRSDKNGWRNLYHYDINGNLLKQITDFEWRINSILAVDEEKKMVYFTGTGDQSTENHLFCIGLNGKNFKQLSNVAGSHRFTLSPNYSFFTDAYSNWTTPPRLELYQANGRKIRLLESTEGADTSESMGKLEYFKIPHPDGFDMPAYWILPENFDSSKKYGVVFQIYGGPNSKNVNNLYVNTQGDYMSQNGIIRFKVDHRGSGHFGKKGLNQIFRQLGKYDVGDYSVAVEWLIKQGFVDETKIGVTGFSYGGYMAALCLTKGADYFTHGFSGAPVTDWRLYDNIYTERYMDTYENNKEGYDQGNVMLFADKLKGKLWLIHGTMDDNVHMQNTIQLIDRLEEESKDFNFMLYPNGRHGWGQMKNKQEHSGRLQREFWLNEFGQ